MKEPKTIKGYITMMKKIEKMSIEDKKGFEQLSKENQELLSELSAAISNRVNEINPLK